MLRNDFVRKLRELESDIKNAGKKNNTHFMVLCASDVEQISWASEEWRQTIFGHFVIEGLRGAAQPTSLARVTVANLHDYVKMIAEDQVLAAAEACVHEIVDLYAKPNLTIEQIRTAFERENFDPVREFSSVCRAELLEIAGGGLSQKCVFQGR
jgi:hypothetical protein